MSGLRAALRVLSNRNVLASELGFLAFTIILHGTWVVTLVFAFAEGGVVEAGVVAFVLSGPSAIAAPFVAVIFGRLSPKMALACGFGAQAIALGLVGAAISLDLHPILVYAGMAIFSITQLATRPTLSSILPVIVRNPSELAAANSMVGVIETAGAFLGPAIAGALLFSIEGFSAPFYAAAILMAFAALITLGVEETANELDEHVMPDSVFTEVAEGWRLLRREADPRVLVVLLALALIIFGALDVALVAVVVDQLGRDEATTGLLGSAIGVGGIAGAALTFLLVGRRRLSLPIAIGLIAIAAPVTLIGLTDSLAAVLILLAVTGLGRPLLEVGGRTVLQGLSAEDTLARLFGFVEGLSLLSLAVGSMGFSLLVVSTSLPIALLVTGLVPLAILATQFARLRSIDHARPSLDPDLVALIRGVSIFAPLPAFRVEQMLLNMDHETVDPGVTVFAKGDRGDLLYVVASGSAIIELDGGNVTTATGGFFGEIALIRDQPRMATVRAGDRGLEVYTLEREVFLAAISSAGRSNTRTNRVIERRLGES